ncbi:MAG TPA: hypothetical protein VNY51_12695 [Candidatus Dormibacteraeota bacterium]|nr:hypothetical protein [Candidatus Dormibacteraeota bacterium]
MAFFEAALHQLKEGGVCAFICADRWMRNQYGAELRELVTSGYGVEVVIEIPHVPAGRKKLIRRAALVEWFKAQEAASLKVTPKS